MVLEQLSQEIPEEVGSAVLFELVTIVSLEPLKLYRGYCSAMTHNFRAIFILLCSHAKRIQVRLRPGLTNFFFSAETGNGI